MLRGNWRFIFAVVGCLTFASVASSQTAPAYGNKVETGSQRAADKKQGNSTEAIGAGNLSNGKQAVQPECGTPKECRAEQRQKDDLVAQQVAAQAAADQARSSWWQTGVGAAGVILLILTIIYTHMATKAAVAAVSTLVGVERARINMLHVGSVVTTDGKNATFTLGIRNVGRTSAVLRETCIQGSATGLYKDFTPTNSKKFNMGVATTEVLTPDTFDFPLGDPQYAFLVGYYKFSTIFGKRVLTDYFCLELGETELPLGAQGAKVAVPVTYRTDLDWPPDEE